MWVNPSEMTKLAVGVYPVVFESESKDLCSRTLLGLLGESGPITHIPEISDHDNE